MADEKATLILTYPVDVTFKGPSGERNERVTELSFRRLNGADMMALGRIPADKDMERMQMLFCRAAGIQPAIYDKLDLEDIAAGMVLVEGFLPPSLRTGKSS